MTYSPYHQRRSIRLKGYDYSLPGAYFVTICTFERQLLFGEVVNGSLQPNQYAHIVHACWNALPNHFALVTPDVFIVMPNHIHCVLWINAVGAQHAAPLPSVQPTRNIVMPNILPGSLGAIVRSFKSAATKRINAIRHTPGTPVWQRNYYEHIIRDDDELNRIRQYIIDNPSNWGEDEDNPVYLP